MQTKLILLTVILCTALASKAQKRVANIPFEFEKSMLAASNYDVNFLNNAKDSAFSLVLKDNKKVEYVLFDRSFKVITKIDGDLKSSIFNEDIDSYVGGTNNGNSYKFIYTDKEKKTTDLLMETVDFDSKSVSHKQVAEIPKTEKLLSSISDYNTYYAITSDDKSGELVIYMVNGMGEYKQKRFPFTVPATASKDRRKISEYFQDLKPFKGNEEPDLSHAVSSAKFFSTRDHLSLVVNDGANPVQIITFSLPDLNMQQKTLDVQSFQKGKDKISVNTFVKNDKAFSLILDKKTIRIVTHDVASGKLVGQYEIGEDFNFGLFATPPVTEKRMGKRESADDVDDVKKLIKALDKGTEGLMITQNAKGQFVVTIGTYNQIALRTGGSSGGYTGGWTQGSMPTTPGITNHGATMTSVSVWDPYKSYSPGTPSYTTYSSRYYTTTYFRVLLDSNASKIDKGRPAPTVADQIKDYLESVDSKAKATNQFAIGERQFYGYYDRDAKAYVIEEIRIRKT